MLWLFLSMKHMLWLFLSLLVSTTAQSLNSLDIEVCADSVMASDHLPLQAAVLARLQNMLSTTGVYATRMYTASATICYMFAYQGRSPTEVRDAVQILLTDTALTQTPMLAVTYGTSSLSCRIAAEPWAGEDVGPLGLNIWQLTASDVLLWGGIAGGILALCSVTVCCFVYMSASKESLRVTKLLAKDRKIMASTVKKLATSDKKSAASDKKSAASDKESAV